MELRIGKFSPPKFELWNMDGVKECMIFATKQKSCTLDIASISYLRLVGTICLCNKNRSVNLEVIHHQPTLIPIFRFSKNVFSCNRFNNHLLSVQPDS